MDPFDIDMSAPITCLRARPRAPAPLGLSTPSTYSSGQRTPIRSTGTRIADWRVTRPELGLYMMRTEIAAPFSRVRSHWGASVTADTENNPLIGLPNQHIVGLTYVP
ncbi:hypothetical protein GCM10010251_82470 [Streptomyces aurantiogriseus]|uniref:Uncharacterized protein n=1 Tax=Streptomyces aurantiogriseus TaxID=66870 RepID=A0A918FM34_9ACTN|nr:hypothetical protein GCM10010251_82470 [Streptomyces aurantiogriseus]